MVSCASSTSVIWMLRKESKALRSTRPSSNTLPYNLPSHNATSAPCSMPNSPMPFFASKDIQYTLLCTSSDVDSVRAQMSITGAITGRVSLGFTGSPVFLGGRAAFIWILDSGPV